MEGAGRILAEGITKPDRRAIDDGLIKPGAPETKHILGKMYLASFLTGEIPPGLGVAV
jgi:hypothetical protein